MSQDKNLTRAAEKRALYTGERYSASLQALRELGASVATIPAATSQQALLETEILLALNGAAYIIGDYGSPSDDDEKTGNLMLISSVHPRIDSIVLDVRRQQLSALIPSLLPYAEGPEDDNVMGIEGLRASICGRGDRLLLHRKGEEGAAYVRVIDYAMKRSDWRDLLDKFLRVLDDAYHIWNASPNSWTQAERSAAQFFAADHSKSSWMCSGILRRLNIFRTSGNPIPAWVDIWDGRLQDGVNLQVEWPNGPSKSRILNFLLDVNCGIDLKVAYEGDTWIKLKSITDKKKGQIVLRHNLALSDKLYSPE
ncbi:hypothetical protein [Streptosporangium sp. H16]|uniref:hypothetical protein n=1 Tax=Streptosporangium sp. H16 TaxID=3444184 RepID=UPI003F794A88